jgi:Spy/CpxP family protein refolding chaperone
LYDQNRRFRFHERNNVMNKLLTIGLLTALTAAVASAQPGQSQGGHKGDKAMKRGPDHAKLMEQLDLTAEQRSALEQAQRDFQKKMVDLRADVKNARDAMRDLTETTSTTREQAMAAVEAESAAELALRKAMVEHRLQVRDIIGEENAAKLKDLRDERRDAMRDQRGGPGGKDRKGPRGDRGPEGDGDRRGPPPDDFE